MNDIRVIHEYTSGAITTFECDGDCLEALFLVNDELIMKGEGLGHMSDIRADVYILARRGRTWG